jgi:hypothetical protein
MGLAKTDRPVTFYDEVKVDGPLVASDIRPEVYTDFGPGVPLPDLEKKPCALWPVRDQGGNVIGFVPLYNLAPYDGE